MQVTCAQATFSYDQGVMSALLTANQFEKTFPQVVESAAHPNHATLQSFVTAIYVRLLILPAIVQD